MRCAYPLLAVLLLAGCSGQSERLYYSTRYIPTDVESSYSSVQREQWKGDPTAYELPASSPALEDEHYVRRTCTLPGPKFKAQQVVGMRGEVRGSSAPSAQVAGGMDKRPIPLSSQGPDKGYPVARMGDVPPTSLGERTQWQQVGAADSRPEAKRGPLAIEATKAGVMRPMAKDDYCLPRETPGLPTKPTK